MRKQAVSSNSVACRLGIITWARSRVPSHFRLPLFCFEPFLELP